jgi:hypothetical protein
MELIIQIQDKLLMDFGKIMYLLINELFFIIIFYYWYLYIFLYQ